MILRDYKYLDTNRVQDYLSSLDLGVVEELTQRIRSGSGKEGGGGINIQALSLGGKGHSQEETETEQTIRITAQHLFHRIYEELGDGIEIFDEDMPIDIKNLRKGQVVEVTREFYPSPVNQVFDSFVEVLKLLDNLGVDQQLGEDVDMQEIMQVVSLFRSDKGDNEVPMVAKPDGQGNSVILVAKENFFLRTEEEFSGEMTLFGKVQKKIPEGSSLDLLDLLKVLPPNIRQSDAFGTEFKQAILKLFEEWPKEFGGPINEEEVIVKGPAVLITPVALYVL